VSAYTSVTGELPESDSELLQALFFELGAGGLEVRDSEAPPMPGVRGPKPGEAIVIAFFDDVEAAKDALGQAQASFPAARLTLEPVENQDWSNAWKALIKSVQVGRLWVGPPWDVAAAPADKLRIVIEPKMAFGTGDHPTTTLCLQAVDEFMAAHPQASVLDVGTGTGVLAIAARKLGATRAVGIDNDAMSVTLAKENAVDNGTPEVELSGKTLDGVGGPYDLVLANILANTLVELAPLMAPKVGHTLVLAGVLAHQEEEVTSAYVAQGLHPKPTARIGDWVRLTLERRA
jgi:ribosomal protein L11 methyltransferase